MRIITAILTLFIAVGSAFSAADSLYFAFEVAASPLQAFNAMVVDWQVRQWSGAQGVAGDVNRGGAWRWTYESGEIEEGLFETIEPMRVLSFAFLVDSQTTHVEIRFQPAADSTALVIRHWGFGDSSVAAESRRNRTAIKWYGWLPRLREYLNKLPGGYVASPGGKGPFAAVVLLHDVFGLNRTVRALADSLASAGMVAVCADMYRGEVTGVMSQAERFSELVDDKAALISAQRALAFVRERSDARNDRVGIWGMGYGGYIALRAAAGEPALKACVVWYPHKSIEPDSAQRITCDVLGVFGVNRSPAPGPDANSLSNLLTQAGVRRQIVMYPGTSGFGDPAYGASYSRSITDQARRKSLQFLEQYLRP